MPSLTTRIASASASLRSSAERGQIFSELRHPEPRKAVFPTINSAHWLGHLIDHYRELGLSVVFAVDARTSDDTRNVLTKEGSKYFDVRGEHPRVESLMQNIVSELKSQWILRLDDDEVPSPALLRFVDKAIKGSMEFTWGFPRVYLRYDTAQQEVQYSRFLPISPMRSPSCTVNWA